MLVPLPIQPGIVTDATRRGAQPRWQSGDKVRFRGSMPEKIGGWERQTGGPVVGTARSLHDWVSLDTQFWCAIGTDKKLYLWQSDVMYDITPLRRATTGSAPPFDETELTDPFDTTNGSATVVVTHASHGAQTGDRVRFYGATAVGGITISGEYEITVLTVNTYQITASSNASSTATGGGTVGYEYDISIATAGAGYGAGAYGAGTYGTPRSSPATAVRRRIWSLDNWGEDLIASPRDGAIYTWDRTNGPSTRAVVISQAPSINNRVIVSAQDRILISVGTHDGSTRNPLGLRWCDREDYTEWTPALTNEAGDQQVDGGSELVTAVRTRGEIILFTDTAVKALRRDPDFVFDVVNIGENITIAGPNAVAESNGLIAWMGKGNFYIYDGVPKVLPCDVHDYVFDRIDTDLYDHVVAAVVSDESEFWWLFTAEGDTENGYLVAWNYEQNIWWTGTMTRTAFHNTSSLLEKPYGIGTDGYLYQHETGTDDNGSGMSVSIESHDFEMGNGASFEHIRKLIPDFELLEQSVTVSVVTRNSPHDQSPVTKGPYTVQSTTTKISLRGRGRQMSIRIASDAVGADWRMGEWRADLVAHGKRA